MKNKAEDVQIAVISHVIVWLGAHSFAFLFVIYTMDKWIDNAVLAFLAALVLTFVVVGGGQFSQVTSDNLRETRGK